MQKTQMILIVLLVINIIVLVYFGILRSSPVSAQVYRRVVCETSLELPQFETNRSFDVEIIEIDPQRRFYIYCY